MLYLCSYILLTNTTTFYRKPIMFLQLKLNAVFFFKDTCDLRNHLLFSIYMQPLNYELIVCFQRNNQQMREKEKKKETAISSRFQQISEMGRKTHPISQYVPHHSPFYKIKNQLSGFGLW